MQQIADWLQKLGLGQYADRFAENDIDFAVLADLTDQDLEKIGVTSLGHRRKLLRAIVDLIRVEGEAPKPISAPAAAIAPHVPSRALDSRSLASATRRTVHLWSSLVNRRRARRRRRTALIGCLGVRHERPARD